MKRVGIHGNGQLGAMLAIAARRLGIECEFYADKHTQTCVGLGPQMMIQTERAASLAQISAQADLITFETENISLTDFNEIAPLKIRPNLLALAAAQDRIEEKNLCKKLGIPTARFEGVNDFDELRGSLERLGTPCILKTRTMGYDGKGQWRIDSQRDLDNLSHSIPWTSFKFIVEAVVDFTRELSLVSVRSQTGEIRHYQLSRNQHVAGILRESSPFESPQLQRSAEHINEQLLNHLDYVGVVAVEFFETATGLLVNEIAPRVHNSGHWTIEGAETSQFENHIRAICGLPLGSCRTLGKATMFNIIGNHPDYEQIAQIKGVTIHDYRKEPRPGRKLGHITIAEKQSPDFENSCRILRSLIST